MEQSDLDLLMTVPLHHLQTLMRTHHIVLPPGQRSETALTSPTTIKEIALSLFDESALRASISELERADMLILHELVACSGRANSRDLALYFLHNGQLGTTRATEVTRAMSADSVSGGEDTSIAAPQHIQSMQYPTAHPHGLFELALHRLLIQGLVFWGKQTSFSGRDYSSGTHDGVLIVPLAVRHLVRAMPLPEEKQAAAETSSIMLSDGMRLFQRKLYLYWSFVAYGREKLAVLGNGLLTRASLRHIIEHLEPREQSEQMRSESEFPHLLFLRVLLMKLDLLQVRNGVLQALPAQVFFTLPLFERVRRCYRLWLESPFWNEMTHLPDVVVRPGPAPLEPAHEEVIRGRQTIVERLLCEQPEQWIAVATFIARTKLYAPYLLFPRQYGPRTDRYSNGSNPYGWDFRLRRGWLTHREGWYMVEGGFIRAIMTGPLSWLGMVEVDRAEQATRFRLAAAARLIADEGVPLPRKQDEGRLIVQPNFELVALAPVTESLLISLDRFAERVSLDLIAQYRLTKSSVTHAVQMGMQAETILDELMRASGGEVPQNVRYSVTEWERQARRVELWQSTTLIEVDDAALLDAFFANEETRRFFGRRLAPHMAEIGLQQLPAVQALLWQRDYLPSLTTAPAQDAVMENGHFVMRETQWRLHPDGMLQPLYPVLDLYLVAEVQRISERDQVTGWQKITAPALQRALEHGLSLDYILRFLQQYCANGIPPSFLIRLKLWGSGYGTEPRIAIENQPLLRLSPQMVQDLRLDDELRALLGPEVEQPSYLIRIKREHLQQVVELLRARGFVVEEEESRE
jgi:hypothetical protein